MNRTPQAMAVDGALALGPKQTEQLEHLLLQRRIIGPSADRWRRSSQVRRGGLRSSELQR